MDTDAATKQITALTALVAELTSNRKGKGKGVDEVKQRELEENVQKGEKVRVFE